MVSCSGLDFGIEGAGLDDGNSLAAVSISIERIRSRLTTMPSVTAEDPPERPLPAPRATTGTRCWAAQRMAV